MTKWKICPDCAKVHRSYKIVCENCGQTLQPKPKKPRKSVEYVSLYHGKVVKRSTYERMQRKDADLAETWWIVVGIAIILGLIKGCN